MLLQGRGPFFGGPPSGLRSELDLIEKIDLGSFRTHGAEERKDPLEVLRRVVGVDRVLILPEFDERQRARILFPDRSGFMGNSSFLFYLITDTSKQPFISAF